MKVLGATILHYGKDYFRASLKSIADHVDEILVCYTSTPSHGSGTNLKCPDTADELRAIANEFNCTWIDVSHCGQENHHRQQYIDYATNKGYDQILVVDSDEIHEPEKIPELLQAAHETGVSHVGVAGSQWITLYRSFNDYVQDGFAPVRVINVKAKEGNVAVDKGQIYHMGYCITDKLMEYKISCHGHAADFNKNRGWLSEKWHGFDPNTTKYLHPATEAYWIETKPFDKTTLPEVLKEHEYYELKRIK